MTYLTTIYSLKKKKNRPYKEEKPAEIYFLRYLNPPKIIQEKRKRKKRFQRRSFR